MTYEQIALFVLFAAIFALLIDGRVRFDLVAFGALIVAVATGLVAVGDAFTGFGHPAVIIIALVLIVSRGLTNSGAIDWLSGRVVKPDRSLPAHIGLMAVVGAALSAVINNVAALALLMTLDIETARKAKRAVALSLMPLSFATILGGMITLIGTPPNIVIAQYRADRLGEPFTMFDFTPVGLVVAIAGIAFVAFVGWRLIPVSDRKVATGTSTDGVYVADLKMKLDSKSIGMVVRELHELGDETDVLILGLVRRGKRLPGFAANETIAKSDHLVVEGTPKAIETFMGKAEMAISGDAASLRGDQRSLILIEAVVPDGSRLVGRGASEMRLTSRYRATLVGLSRHGRRFREQVRKLPIQAGDVLLLLGPPDSIQDSAERLGLFVIEGRKTPIIDRSKAGLAIVGFLAAVATAVAGFVPLDIALGACVIFYIATGMVGKGQVYETIEWKVIVLLASLIPLGAALETSGSTALIANAIVDLTQGWPAWAILMVLMIVTMTLSDILNNVATALVAAPVAVDIAQSLNANPDPFLMGVAVAASCAFLTPIGHKNNTIIMGPGGYQFGDYWRMGLPLEIVVLAVSVPTILAVWPL